MKAYTILLLLIIMMITNHAFSQLAGDWEGTMEIQGAKLKIVFHIQQTDNKYTATFDSPDQNAYGLPTGEVIFDNPEIEISIPMIGADYKGELKSLNEIVGTFKQAGFTSSLNLKVIDIVKGASQRPQTPKKPYPYYSKDVIIVNEKDSIQLFGTLTLPDSIGEYPIAILISGSGSQDRDETIFGHKPFLVLADYLTKNGIGVLRFDDRHYGKSTEMLFSTTAVEIANDVESCVDYLKSKKTVSSNGIGLIGHSAGGLSAAIVSSKNPNIAFTILLATPGISGDEIIYSQTKEILFEGLNEHELEEQIKLRKDLITVLKNEPNKKIARESLKTILYRDLDVTFVNEVQNTIKEIQNTIEIFNSDMFRYFVSYNPAKDLEKITCPVLALIGEKDIQVMPEQNLPAIEKALKDGGNKNYLVKEIPNVNHLFQTAKTGKVNEYGEIEETISPVVLDLISNWIIALNLKAE